MKLSSTRRRSSIRDPIDAHSFHWRRMRYRNDDALFNFHDKQLKLTKTSCGLLRYDNKLRQAAVWLAESPAFGIFNFVAIIVNSVFLGLYDYKDTQDISVRNQIVTSSEAYFTAIFTFECVVKIIAYGFVLHKRAYMRDKWNWLDFLVVVTGLASLAVGIGSISFFRTFRVFRPLRNLTYFSTMRRVLDTLFQSIGNLGNVVTLLLFVLILFGVLGVNFWMGRLYFRCRLTPTPVNGTWVVDPFNTAACTTSDGDNFCPATQTCGSNYEPPAGYPVTVDFDILSSNPTLDYGYMNFDDLGSALMVLFQALTIEGWSDLMYMFQNVMSPAFASIYFIMFVLIGNFLVLNLSLAVLYDSFSMTQGRGRAENRVPGGDISSGVSERRHSFSSSSSYPSRHASSVISKTTSRFTRSRLVTLSSHSSSQLYAWADHPIVDYCFRIVNYRYFNHIMMAVIVANTIVLSLDRYPAPDPDSQLVAENLNLVFTAIFTVELILKSTALGFRYYLRSGENTLDFIVVVSSLVEIIIGVVNSGSTSSSTFSALRVFRLLRIGKMIKNVESLRRVAQAVSRTMASLRDFAILLLVVMYVFSLLGMRLFAGKFQFPGETQIRYHYDDLLWAFTTTFQAFTDENWNIVWYTALRVEFYSSLLYFLVYMIIGRFLLFELFIAVLISNFTEAKTRVKAMYKLALDRQLWGLKQAAAGSYAEEPRDHSVLEVESMAGQHEPFSPDGLLSPAPCETIVEQGEDNLTRTEVVEPTPRASIHKHESYFEPEQSPVDPPVEPQEEPISISVVKAEAEPQPVNVNMNVNINLGPIFEAVGESTHLPLQNSQSSSSLLSANSSNSSSQRDLPLAVARRPSKQHLPPLDIDRLKHHLDTDSKVELGHESNTDVPGSIREDGQEGHRFTFASAVNSFDSALPPPPAPAPAPVIPLISHRSNGSQRSVGKPLSFRSVKNEVTPFVPLEAESLSEKQPDTEADDAKKDIAFSALEIEEHGAEDMLRKGDVIIYKPDRRSDRPLYLVSKNSRFYHWVNRFANWKAFEMFILVLIFTNCILMAVDDPLDDPESSIQQGLDSTNIAFTTVFLLEMIVKILSKGLIVGETAYLRNGWDIMDCFVVLISLVDVSVSSVKLSFVRSLRVLRVVRPLRLLNRNPGLKLAINTLFRCIPGVASVLAVMMLFCLMYGILGVSFFKGLYQYCDTSGPLFSGVNGTTYGMVTSADCISANGEWKTYPANFDNILWALFSLFEMITAEGWMDLLMHGVDGVGPDIMPVIDYSPPRVFYFIIYMIIARFFLLNMFVGSVIESFQSLKKEMAGEELFMTREQKRWVEISRAFLTHPHSAQPKLLGNVSETRKKAYTWLTPRFDNIVTGLICFNNLIIAMIYYQMPPEYASFIDIMSTILSVVFSLEIAFKIYVFRLQFFSDNWNVFDFVVVAAADALIILSQVDSSYSTISSAARVFRLLRTIKLLNTMKSFRTLFLTFVSSLPSLMNIGILLFLFVYIYAILGMNLFSTVMLQKELNSQANFRTFGMSLLTMFRCTTGEAWQGLMHDLMLQDTYQGVACMGDVSYADIAAGNINGCGSYVAIPFMISYQVIVAFVLLNLFVAVVLEAFADEKKDEESERVRRSVQCFIDEWTKEDRFGTRFVSPFTLAAILRKVPTPLGFLDSDGVSQTTSSVLKTIAGWHLPMLDRRLHFKDVCSVLAARFSGTPDLTGNASRLVEQMEKQWKSRFPELKMYMFSPKADFAEHYAASVIYKWVKYRRLRKADSSATNPQIPDDQELGQESDQEELPPPSPFVLDAENADEKL